MLHPLKKLNGMTLGTEDGEIGKVKDVYFDDASWGVRYLIVETGSWLSGRKVLVSPRSVRGVDWDKNVVHVALTKQQIKDSPDIDTDKPVSRQHEVEFSAYYGYPVYWDGQFLWGPYPPLAEDMASSERMASEFALREKYKMQAADHHLRSARDLVGYHIHANDGSIGHIDEFLFDDAAWGIRYIVIDTVDWWVGKHVIIPPQWMKRLEWTERTLYLDIDRATVKSCPEYNSNVILSRDYEARLHNHYGRAAYWDGE